jgi:hypothetical protein
MTYKFSDATPDLIQSIKVSIRKTNILFGRNETIHYNVCISFSFFLAMALALLQT